MTESAICSETSVSVYQTGCNVSADSLTLRLETLKSHISTGFVKRIKETEREHSAVQGLVSSPQTSRYWFLFQWICISVIQSNNSLVIVSFLSLRYFNVPVYLSVSSVILSSAIVASLPTFFFTLLYLPFRQYLILFLSFSFRSFCTILVGNIYSIPIFRPSAHNIGHCAHVTNAHNRYK